MAKNAKRTRNLYNPLRHSSGQANSLEPFKLSRSKIEFFLECPRCFYLDRRLGVGRPDMPSFTLNSAVDTLLKKEFDIYRAKGLPHPIMRDNFVDAIPFSHPDLNIWRENFKGVQFLHKETNLLITGAVDDIWIDSGDGLIVVDYKSTSTLNSISLDDEYKQAYKRQMEIYQWLLRNNGFTVRDIGYFVYANGRTDLDAFDKKLEFSIQLIPYTGNASWVDGTIQTAHNCLINDNIPEASLTCKYCNYREAARDCENRLY